MIKDDRWCTAMPKMPSCKQSGCVSVVLAKNTASSTIRHFDMKFAFKLLLVTLTLCAFPFGFVAAGLHVGLSLGYRAFASLAVKAE